MKLSNRYVLLLFLLISGIELRPNNLMKHLNNLQVALTNLGDILQEEPPLEKKFDPAEQINILDDALDTAFKAAQEQIKKMVDSLNQTENLIVQFVNYVKNNKNVESVSETPEVVDDLTKHIRDSFSKEALQAFIDAANGLALAMRSRDDVEAIKNYLSKAIEYFDDFWFKKGQYEQQVQTAKPSFPFLKKSAEAPVMFFKNYVRVPVADPENYIAEGTATGQPAILNYILRDTAKEKRWFSKAY